MQVALTEQDVERLTTDRSTRARVVTASKVADIYASGRLSPAERRVAEDIIGVFVNDIEVAVREALSEQLKRCPFLPHSLALALAHDVESVAIPMLQYSEALTDGDLIDVVRASGLTRQLAIARRRHLSEAVSDALVDAGREEVTVTLLANGGADISEAALHRVVDRYGDHPKLHGPLVRRTRLPPSVAERLVTLVSEEFKGYLVRQHKLPIDLATPITRQAREQVVATFVPCDTGYPAEGQPLVRHMWRENHLTPTMLLRALCEGKIRFFEESLALLARVPAANVATLLRDPGPLGLKALYRRAGLPPKMYRAFRAAVDIAIRNAEPREDEAARIARMTRILDSLVEQYDDLGPGDLEATLYRLSR